MIKLKRVLIFSILILVFFCEISKQRVFASSRNYYISDIVINAVVKENGDMEVEERHNYVFEGAFNGVKRNVKTDGSDGVFNISTEVSSNGRNEIINPEITKNSDSTEIKINSKSNDEEKAFIIRYTLKNVITRFSDVGELKWIFYKNEADVKTNNIMVYISLPETITNEVKYYGEGPKRGTASIDSNRIKLQLTDMSEDEVIGAEVNFPTNWISTSKKINMKKDSYYENEKRKEKRNIAIVIICILSVITISGTLIYIKRKKREKAIKEYRAGNVFFNDEYCFELPDSLPPALVSVLLGGKIEIKDLLATILDLAGRGLITFLEDGFKSKDYNAIAFKVNEGYMDKNLKPYETFLIEWLKGYYKKGVIKLKYLKEKSKENSFQDKYYDWKELILNEAEALNFYTVVAGKKILTNEYKNEEKKWKAYKRYLEDYEGIREDKKQKIEDKVFSYAIVLDCYEDITQDAHNSVESSNIFMSYWFLSYYAVTYNNDFSKDYSSGIDNNSSYDTGGNFSGGSGAGFGGGGGGSAF